MAFGYDSKQDKFVRLWRSVDTAGKTSTLGAESCLWGGVTIADIDGGKPEIFYRGAMHDADGVSGRQAVRQLNRQVDDFAGGDSATVQALAHVFAVDEFHDEEPRVVCRLEAVDTGDVGVL